MAKQTFFERNKRKGLLALLLLLLRWRKGTVPLLVMLLLVMFLFIAPNNLSTLVLYRIAQLPGGWRVAAAITWAGGLVGVDFGFSGLSDSRSFVDLMAAFEAAREGRGDRLFRGGQGARPPERSSLDMLVPAELEKIAGPVTGKVSGGETVNGIMTPDESRDTESHVELTQADLSGERLAQLAAGAGGRVPEAFAGGFGPPGSVIPFATSNFFAGPPPGRFAQPGDALSVRMQREATTARGRRSRATEARAAQSRRNGAHAVPTRASRRAFVQLTDGRSRTMMARDPICTVWNGCPPEYAQNNVAAVFDGNAAGLGAGRVIDPGRAVPGLSGVNTPNANIPSTNDLNELDEEARKLQRWAEQCRQANDKYLGTRDNPGPETQAMKDIQRISNEMNAACSGGGCSKSKAAKCKRMGEQMRARCHDLDNQMYQHYLECPLMQQDGPYQHQAC